MSKLVLAEVLPRVRVEEGSVPPKGRERVALVASYGDRNVASLSLATLVSQLERGGYFVIVVRASDDPGDLVWPEGLANSAIVVHKPNIGYDFGSWATGLELYPRLMSARLVLLMNDSLVGPFESIQPMLDEFERSDYDVWGVTNTTQILPHLQSYVLGFKDGILRDPALVDFWSGIRIIDDKNTIIERYEIGLSRLLYSEGYLAGVWFDHSLVVNEGLNPSLWGWRRLLDLGFPFVKRQLLTLPELVLDGEEIPETIRGRYGVDPLAWI